MPANDRTVRHPLFARLYTRLSASNERKGQAELRDELLFGLSGRVIEIGAGTGHNFAHYPSTVTQVIAVEPEHYLRQQAERAAERAPVPVSVVEGVAEELSEPDHSCDAGVAALVLCSVHDPEAALAELHRIIRPGGELRFLEHVRANRPGMARAQRFADATFWPLVAGGCHASRETGETIEAAGFSIESCRRFAFRPALAEALTAPHILGRARRVGSTDD